MKFLPTLCFCASFFAVAARADSVVLFIGDGMGVNHMKCAGKALFMDTLPVQTTFKTYSADNAITDSAAGGTAFSCGVKTNNEYVAITPDKKPCVTLTEQSVADGLTTGLYSTDETTGATQACFFAHTDRWDKDGILRALEKIKATTDTAFELPDLKSNARAFLEKAAKTGKPFFLMMEQSRIDSKSHKHEFDDAMAAVIDLDDAVRVAVDFSKNRPDMTVVIVADHETGGLTEQCRYTEPEHTGADVRLIAAGKHASLFADVKDNTDVHDRILTVLRKKDGFASALSDFFRRMKSFPAD